jgi:hypothetical protein
MIPSMRTAAPRRRFSSLNLQSLEDRATPAGLRVALISDAVAQAEQVAAAAASGVVTVPFDATTADWAGLVGALEQVSVAHDGAQIRQLGLVAHGRAGAVVLGPSDTLNLRDVSRDSDAWSGLRDLLTPDARIDLYACNVADGRAGTAFVKAIAARTGADVAASNDIVGQGGDFVWEFNTGGRRAELFHVPSLKEIAGLALEDAYEPNDTKAQADVPAGGTSPNLGTLTEPRTITGLSLEADTEDWYRFTLAGIGTFNDVVRLDAIDENGDLNLAVYGPDGITLVGFQADGGTETVRLYGLPPGNYYAVVYPHNAGFGNPNYTLQIDPPPAAPDDAYESNDNKSQADRPPGANSPNLGVLTAPTTLNNLVLQNDEDWYRFELAGIGTFNDVVRLDANDDDGDINLAVYGPDGITLVGFQADGGTETVRLFGLPPGTYYARVYPHTYPQNSNPSYTLQIDPPPAAPDDAYEPNDNKAQADLPVGANSPNFGPVAGSLVLNDLALQGDEDWYRFELTQTATAANFVRLDANDDDGDINLAVYRSNGTTLVGFEADGGTEQVELAGMLAGTYYIRVYPHTFPQNSNPDYTLQIVAPGSGLTLAGPATIAEGDAGTTTATFTVTRNDASGPASVSYATTPGTATAGTDYQTTSGTLNFAAGELTKTINVPIVGDTAEEPDETFFVTLSNPSGAILNNQQVTGLIRDDDDAGTLQFSAPVYTVSEGVGTAVVKVNRVGGTDGTVTVQYTTADATAASPADYAVTSGTLTFNTGEATKNILVPIVNDADGEPDEYFEVTLTNPTGGAVLGGDGLAEVHIQPSDPRPGSFVFSAATFSSPEGSGVLSITVDRVGGVDGPATVKLTVADKTAKKTLDYVATTGGILSFADGQTSQTFDIDLIDDGTFEPDETISLTLSTPTGGATLGAQKTAIGMIANDDFLMGPKTFVAGAGSTGKVAVIDGTSGAVRATIVAYPGTVAGGVRVAVGDVSGDGVPDIVTAPGAGAGPQVRVFDGSNGEQLAGNLGAFFAYPVGFTGGVQVAVADVDGDTRPDIVTASGPGQAAQVKVFSGVDRSVLFDFPAAFAASGVQGATVAAADMTGDGKAEIIVGSGPGGPPEVRIFDGSTGTALAGPRGRFTPFADAGFVGGVTVAAGDIDGDNKAEVIVGTGAGIPAKVQAFSSADVTPLFANPIIPFGASFKTGVTVALGQVDGLGGLDLIVGPAKGAKKVTAFDLATRGVIKAAAPFGATYSGGANVAGRR